LNGGRFGRRFLFGDVANRGSQSEKSAALPPIGGGKAQFVQVVCTFA